MSGLSLTRRENESIIIDDSLRVTVTRVSRTQVRLRFETIEGKPQLSVMREELYNAIDGQSSPQPEGREKCTI